MNDDKVDSGLITVSGQYEEYAGLFALAGTYTNNVSFNEIPPNTLHIADVVHVQQTPDVTAPVIEFLRELPTV